MRNLCVGDGAVLPVFMQRLLGAGRGAHHSAQWRHVRLALERHAPRQPAVHRLVLANLSLRGGSTLRLAGPAPWREVVEGGGLASALPRWVCSGGTATTPARRARGAGDATGEMKPKDRFRVCGPSRDVAVFVVAVVECDGEEECRVVVVVAAVVVCRQQEPLERSAPVVGRSATARVIHATTSSDGHPKTNTIMGKNDPSTT